MMSYIRSLSLFLFILLLSFGCDSTENNDPTAQSPDSGSSQDNGSLEWSSEATLIVSEKTRVPIMNPAST